MGGTPTGGHGGTPPLFSITTIARPWVALAAGLALWSALILRYAETEIAAELLPNIARYLAAELFLVAGVAFLAQWRITRRPETLRSAVALVIVGTAFPTLAVALPWVSDGVHVTPQAAIARVGVLLPVFALLIRRRSADSARPKRRQGALVAMVPVLAVTGLAAVLGDGLASPVAQRTVACAVELTAALGWVLLGVQRRRRSVCETDRWAGNAMLLMAAGEYSRAVSIAGLLPPTGIHNGLQLGAAATVAIAAFTGWRAVHAEDGARTHALGHALSDARRLLAGVEQQQRERLHDARSAVVGVLGASELLSRPTNMSALDRTTLQALMAAELARLQLVLDSSCAEECTSFDVGATLGPVLLTHQLGGTPIRLRLDAATAFGRPQTTATVVDNLLRNARTHAPGATITVSVRSLGDHVRLTVEDDGPGISTQERNTVLLPGVRGSSAQGDGSGLGLYNCARAVGEQGGGFAIGEVLGGGLRIVITLPAADPALDDAADQPAALFVG